jgi:glycolate oxidase FAD binding subunit
MAIPSNACTIDDVDLLRVVRPASTAELCELVRQARADGQALFPLGGRTMLGIGLPPARPGIGVDLTALDRVIDYPARDMTITLQAGITVARLQELLKNERQRLPVDVPAPERATLGGLLATNTSGPRRYGFGTVRDYVIGISTVNGEGQETKGGGRVVKNVAGYDMCKLHIGALGTLGIITQVTLKLRPMTEESALVVCRCESADLEAVLAQLHETRTRPICLDVLNSHGAARLPSELGQRPLTATSCVLVAGFEENAETVRWQVQQLIKELAAARTQGIAVLANAVAVPLWRFLCEFRLDPEAVLTFKANLQPHAVAGFCRKVSQFGEPVKLHAHAGNGIVIGHLAGGLTVDRAATMLKELRNEAGAAQGNVVVLHCPPAWKPTLPIWGEPRGDVALMKAVRDKLDPHRLFNPGRFLV